MQKVFRFLYSSYLKSPFQTEIFISLQYLYDSSVKSFCLILSITQILWRFNLTNFTSQPDLIFIEIELVMNYDIVNISSSHRTFLSDLFNFYFSFHYTLYLHQQFSKLLLYFSQIRYISRFPRSTSLSVSFSFETDIKLNLVWGWSI